MPTYEYLCEDCDYEFEEFQSITADPIESCPKCHGHVRRLISAGTGLIFKGSGFYITDYKHSNGSTASRSNGEKKSKAPDNKKAPEKSKKTDD